MKCAKCAKCVICEMSAGGSGDAAATAKGTRRGSCCSAALPVPPFRHLRVLSAARRLTFLLPCLLFVYLFIHQRHSCLRIKGGHSGCHPALCRCHISVPTQDRGWGSSPSCAGTQGMLGNSSPLFIQHRLYLSSRQQDEMYIAQKQHGTCTGNMSPLFAANFGAEKLISLHPSVGRGW